MTTKPALVLLLLTGLLTAQAPDDRASTTPMFGPSGTFGTSGPFLTAINPPLLGTPFGLSVSCDPSAGFGITFGSLGGHSGIPLTLVDPLTLYLDPLALILELPFPIAGGIGSAILPIPPDPLFLGLDLAFQSAVLTPTGVGASNLLVANLGTQVGVGAAVCAFAFSAHLEANTYYQASGQPLPIYCNSSNHVCQVTITGTRNGTGGRLEIRNSQTAGAQGGASILAVIPTVQQQFAVTVTVQPGQCLYLFNRDDANGGGVQSGPIDVTYQVSSHCQ